MGFCLPYGDNQHNWEFPNFRVWEEIPGCLFLLVCFFFFFFLAACGVPGVQARGFSGPLEHLPAAHGARGAHGRGGGLEPCLPPGPWETEPRGKLGRAWAEESDFGCGRLAPDSLVILEDKDLQGAW